MITLLKIEIVRWKYQYTKKKQNKTKKKKEKEKENWVLEYGFLSLTACGLKLLCRIPVKNLNK